MQKNSPSESHGRAQKPKLSRAQKRFFERIWQMHWEAMYRAAFMGLRNECDAEDACQQTMLQLIPHEHKLSVMDDSRLKRYIMTSVRHTVVSMLRARNPEVFLPEEVIDETTEPDAMPENVSQLISHEKLKAALMRLNEKDRLLLQWKYLEGLDDEEISAALSCKRSSVHVLVYRTKARLMKILKEDEWFDEE